MSRSTSTGAFGRLASAGFVLPSAIFLLVILAGLAAFLVHISTTQSITSAQDIQGVVSSARPDQCLGGCSRCPCLAQHAGLPGTSSIDYRGFCRCGELCFK